MDHANDIPFTQPPSPPAHAESDPQPQPPLLPDAQLSDPPFAVPPELLAAAAASFPSQNIQAVLSLHKALTQHLSGLGYESLKQGAAIDSPPSQDTTVVPAIETPNNERTFPLFRFHDNGRKMLKHSRKRKYFKCNEANCPATYTLTKSDSGGSPTETRMFSSKPHNHLPPPNPPINPEVKERSIAHMRVGASPANIHKHLVQKAPLPLSSSDVPTPGMLRKWKYRDAHKDSESNDVIVNILARHNLFVRKIEMHPNVFIVACSDFGLRIIKESEYLVVDGTFETTEAKLVLTTILGFHDEIAIPSAYMLSDSKETDTYEAFYRLLQKASKGLLSPLGVALDFEDALAEGFVRVFPKAIVCGDFFHFMQANVKKCRQLRLQQMEADIVCGARNLFHAANKDAFDLALDNFLKDMDKRAPAYAAYFRRTWLNHHAPEKWASFARPPTALTGSAAAEGYHRRLDEIMPSRVLAADKMVDFLASEDEYWQRMVNDPRQWNDKKKQHRSAQARNQKRRLTITTYLSSNKSSATTAIPLDYASPEKEQNTTTTSTASDTASNADSDIIDLVDYEPESMRPSSPAPSVTPDTSPCPSPIISHKNTAVSVNRRALVDPSKLCAKCKQRKANNACSQRSCKTCCAETTARCSLTDHMREKKGARQPYGSSFAAPVDAPSNPQAGEFERRIREVMTTKKRIFIAYKGDGLCREIEPLRLEEGREGLLMRAMDHTKNGERSFYVTKITRMEDNSWQPMAEATAITTTQQQALPSTPLQWLQEFGMEKYAEALEKNGYDSIHLVSVIDESELDSLGITIPPHRKLFLVKVKELLRRPNAN